MNLKIKFKNFERTEAIDGVIKKKSDKLKKYLSKNAHLNWNCFTDRNDQLCEVQITKQNGKNIRARAKSESLYKSIDMVINKLIDQLQKRRRPTGLKSHKKHLSLHELGHAVY